MQRWVLAGAVLAATGALGAGPCPHPYFPMQEGLTLTYRAGKAEVVVSLSDVKKDGDSMSALLQMHHKDRDGATRATCSPEGVRTELGGLEGAALSMSGMEVNVVSSEGIAMPPPDQMKEGATWANTLALELRPPKGSKLSFGVIKTTFKKESLVEGAEKVEVAGKKWDALRVRNKITAMAGTSGERSIDSMMWVAPEVGILRIKTGDSVDFELLRVEKKPKATAVGGGGSEGEPKGAAR